MAETNVILKYRRPQDSWLCPECDSENTLSYSNCSVCGCIRGGTSVIVKAWSEADERPPVPPRTPVGGTYINRPPVSAPPRSLSRPAFTASDRAGGPPLHVEKESHPVRTVMWIIAILAVVVWIAVWLNS